MEIRKRERSIGKRRNTKTIFLLFLLFFLFFPYILSLFCGNEKEVLKMEEVPGTIWVEKKSFWGSSRIELEEYLVGMLAGTISPEFEMETLKAQAIILRSHCVSLTEKKEAGKIVEDEKIKDYYLSPRDYKRMWGKKAESYYKKIEKAVQETTGKILIYQDEIIAPPFFLSGNGKTRDMADYPQEMENLGYIKAVVCQKDMESENYSNYKEFTEKEFKERIEKYFGNKEVNVGKITLYKDKSDYVKVVEIGNRQMKGEDFRHLFELNSSCFGLEKINEKIQFKTIGKGHGFGFSQFQANELAKEGNEAMELLLYFFQDIEMEKI